MIARVALGTAQFGQNYGIANKSGMISVDQIQKIFSAARKYGVDTIDTAMSYGESELILGRIGVDKFRVITKLPEVPCGTSIRLWIRSCLIASLRRLNSNSIYGLLLHRASQLRSPIGEEIIYELQDLKKSGLINKIGVSIYAPDDLDDNLLRKIDIVQSPYSILDQRLFTSGLAKKLKDHEVEIHVRSIFLQGLLLMNDGERPEKFKKWGKLWSKWNHWLCEHEISPLHACVNFALFRHEIDRVIIGVDSALQFKEIMEIPDRKRVDEWPNFEEIDINLINPSRWINL